MSQNVAHLITQFITALQAGERARWRQADLAAAIEAKDPQALRTLHEQTQLSVRYLQDLARVARAYPAATRFATLSIDHHRRALNALDDFPEGTPEHVPSYWLQLAKAHQWNRNRMVRAMRQHLVAQPTPTQRRTWLLQQQAVADADYQDIVEHLTRHNQVHALYRGVRLVLQEVPLDTIQSTPA